MITKIQWHNFEGTRSQFATIRPGVMVYIDQRVANDQSIVHVPDVYINGQQQPGYSSMQFKTIEEAQQWCEVMYLTGAL